LVASISQLPYPKRIAPFGRIHFAVALPKADCSLWSHPFRIGRTQSPLKTSTPLMFLLFHTYPLNQASLIRVYA
jgi:hypothetical protein